VYYCKAHTYLILLNRQRLDKYTTQSYGSNAKTTPPAFRPVNKTSSSQLSPTTTTTVSLRGRALVLASSENILDAFLFFYLRVPAALISWTMAQQAFNSCMILLLDALERCLVTSGAIKTEKAYVVFQQLQNVHTLASIAVERISWGLKKLHDVTQMSPGQHEPREPHGKEAETHGSWNEATHDQHAMYEDAVMNMTGMFLLEDPGLQGFVPEAFTPIAWNLGGIEPPVPFQLKREREFIHSVGLMDSPGSGEETDHVRSSTIMQGNRRSTTMRSAPTRYATPALDDRQPPGGTAATLHTDGTRPMHQHHESQAMFPEGSHRPGHPPHLRHTQLCEESNNGWGPSAVANTVDKRQPPYARGVPGVHQVPTAQMRHNSCPALHQPAPAPSLQRLTYSSPAAPKGQAPIAKTQPLLGGPEMNDLASFQEFLETMPQSAGPDTSPNDQLSWAVRAAARSATFQPHDSAALNCVLPFHVGNGVSGFSQGGAHEQLTASAYPCHFSAASSMTTPLGAENLSVDEWRRWIGSSGAA
jgi:hypothetical protein